MRVIYVLLLCTILNVLATKDLDFFRSELENTNILIGAHINAKTMWDMIHFFVEQDNISMEQLIFMFAIPERDHDPDTQTQLLSEIQLQKILFETSGLDAREVEAGVTCLISVKDLGKYRRHILKPHLRNLLIYIIKNLNTYNKGFEHTCRLLGLFMSMETKVPYATSADVTPPPDSTCVIRHGSVVLQSFKQFIHFIRFVNNENHGEKGQSILAFLQNY
ncbi:uncharacterized protein LOC126833104 [Adelges cooleyi]|uniref:uncharacterized protein LOC126833104 n=1 Tax=Adelges cooleyi TaxID=133065 RepID=UPI0021806933|nr:uncharacterized protein LOC126833104 [Adelges cooleyi]